MREKAFLLTILLLVAAGTQLKAAGLDRQTCRRALLRSLDGGSPLTQLELSSILLHLTESWSFENAPSPAVPPLKIVPAPLDISDQGQLLEQLGLQDHPDVVELIRGMTFEEAENRSEWQHSQFVRPLLTAAKITTIGQLFELSVEGLMARAKSANNRFSKTPSSEFRRTFAAYRDYIRVAIAVNKTAYLSSLAGRPGPFDPLVFLEEIRGENNIQYIFNFLPGRETLFARSYSDLYPFPLPKVEQEHFSEGPKKVGEMLGSLGDLGKTRNIGETKIRTFLVAVLHYRNVLWMNSLLP